MLLRRKIDTRSVEECIKIARLWAAGDEAEAIRVMGHEPSEYFVSVFLAVAPSPEATNPAATPEQSARHRAPKAAAKGRGNKGKAR